jgi:Tfp pilus assembly PilM family ATPase
MLSAITQPSYPKAAIGFEKDSITALALQKEGRGQYGIRQAATVDLPSNLLVPSFLEKNIASQREFAVLIEEAVVNSGLLNQKKWSISLPSNTARTAIFTLENEPSSKQEVEDILDWKAEQIFGVPSGELRISRQKISDDRDGKSRYFASAVKLSVIDEYETVFEGFGWKAGLILPRAISEAHWLSDKRERTDSLLISSQEDGFTALLLRGDEPTVVRSVTCAESERDDEIYRLLMFYKDRLGDESSGNFLDRLLIIGKNIVPSKIKEISADALGRALTVLRPEDVGLYIPSGSLSFDDLAAPAGLAALGC